MTGNAAEGSRSTEPALIDERTAAARLTRRWLAADKSVRPSTDELLEQVVILSEAGRLLLYFWDAELPDNDKGGLPSASLRAQRRQAVIAKEFETACADGRARVEALHRLLSDGEGPSATILEETRAVAATLTKVSGTTHETHKIVVAHSEDLKLAIPGSDAENLRNAVDKLVQKLVKRRHWSIGGVKFAWYVQTPLEGLIWWLKEASKILAGVLGAIFILKALGPAMPWLASVGLGWINVLSHEVSVYSDAASQTHREGPPAPEPAPPTKQDPQQPPAKPK